MESQFPTCTHACEAMCRNTVASHACVYMYKTHIIHICKHRCRRPSWHVLAPNAAFTWPHLTELNMEVKVKSVVTQRTILPGTMSLGTRKDSQATVT